jgi:hypothetical protein
MYDLGYACTECGVPGLAVRPLALALELVPDSVPALGELVSALEQDAQHARVLTVLEEHVLHLRCPPQTSHPSSAITSWPTTKGHSASSPVLPSCSQVRGPRHRQLAHIPAFFGPNSVQRPATPSRVTSPG